MDAQAYCFARSFEPAGRTVLQTDRHYLLYALSGVLRLEAEGQRWTLPPSRAALIRADCPISVTILSRLESASVLFAPSFMAAPARTLAVFDMSPLARELVKECRQWGADTGALPPHALVLFGALAAVALQLAAAPTPCVLPVPKSPALREALRLTEAAAAGAPSFTEVARQSGQSPRALARRFAAEMGMTWREALRRIRIIRAVELLAGGNMQVTEAALAVGYNSLSGFNTAFRELMDMTPSDYRARITRSREEA
jgi:AraC-like DNA-binding protein